MDSERSYAAAILATLLFSLTCYPPFTRGDMTGDMNMLESNRLETKEDERLITAIKMVEQQTTLSQVLEELLRNLEYVEQSGLPCTQGLREKHTEGQHALADYGQRCLAGLDDKNDLKEISLCLENETRPVVSDFRVLITRLKDCVDHF